MATGQASDATVGERAAQVVTAFVARVVDFLPELAAALLLLALGWLAAAVLRSMSRRALVLLDVVAKRFAGARFAGARFARRVRFADASRVVGSIVYWAVLIAFLAAAAEALGLQAFTHWLTRLLDYLPELVAGLLIVVAGYVASRVVADLIVRAPGPLAPAQQRIAARAAQVAILAAALLVASEQVGIRVTLLAIIVGIGAVAIAGGVVVAISLGARQHVANLIGVQQMRRRFLPGQRIRVAGFEGRVLEFGTHAVVLETDEGSVAIPGHVFGDEPVVLLGKRAVDG
ncbi:MAG: membrane protein [Betaproteobacteria bacterium]|nr:MAG: membrane protein [Betaproteobacteria bacterium]